MTTFNPNLPAKTTKGYKVERLVDGVGFGKVCSAWKYWMSKSYIGILIARDDDGNTTWVYPDITDNVGNLVNTPRTITRWVHWYRYKGDTEIGCCNSPHESWTAPGFSTCGLIHLQTDGPFEIEIPPDVEV